MTTHQPVALLPDRKPESKQEHIQLERNEKKFDLIQTVQQDYQKGKKKSVLAKEFDLDPRTITKYLNTTNTPIFKLRGKKTQDSRVS